MEKLIEKYANSGKIRCLNCSKRILKGFSSWCCFKCSTEYCKKRNLHTQREINKSVFADIKKIIMENN